MIVPTLSLSLIRVPRTKNLFAKRINEGTWESKNALIPLKKKDHNHQRPQPGFLLWLPNGLPASNHHPPHPISSQPEVGATLLEPTSDRVPPLLRTLPWYPRHSEQKPRFLQWPTRPYVIVIWLLSPLLLSGVLDVHGIHQSRLRLQAFAPALPSACNVFPPEICFPKPLT